VQAITTEQARLLNRGHDAIFRAEVLNNGVPVVTLQVQDGRVDVDGANAIRRKMSATLVGDDLIPGDTRSGNLALGQPMTYSDPLTVPAYAQVPTDGQVATSATVAGPGAKWAQVDLGSVLLIDRVRVWHFYSDGRTYNAPMTEVSADGVRWTVVARPAPYAETATGNLRRFAPVRARYVRDWVNGSTGSSNSQWSELQVFAAQDPLSPYGNEIRVWRGVRVPGGVDKLWPQGVFGITRPSVSDTGSNLLITVTGEDRARTVQRARMRADYKIADGTNYATAIKALIRDGVPFLQDADFSFTPTTRTTPALTVKEGEDRWAFAQKMATDLGCDLFFDPSGRCTLTPVRATVGQPTDWEIREGVSLLAVVKEQTADATYNHVVVTGETQDPEDGSPKIPPVRGEAWDDDPDSPTYIGGDFGDVATFFVSPFVKTQAQAVEVAKAILERSLALTERLVVDALVCPALEPYDLIYVRRDRLRVNNRYLLETFSIPLNPEGVMPCSMQKRRV
jgi:hypothetical protein